jgi:hypothetical protein
LPPPSPPPPSVAAVAAVVVTAAAAVAAVAAVVATAAAAAVPARSTCLLLPLRCLRACAQCLLALCSFAGTPFACCGMIVCRQTMKSFFQAHKEWGQFLSGYLKVKRTAYQRLGSVDLSAYCWC